MGRRGGERLWHSPLVFFCLSFFLSLSFFFFFLTPPSRSMDGDTVIKPLWGQTIWSRQWSPVQGGGGGGGTQRERERDREREARTGPQGKRRAEWRISFQSTDTLLNYSTLSPSDTHSPFPPTHTYTHTHTTLISPLLNEVQRHLHCKQHCSLKLETSCYRPATRTWSLKTVRSSIITKRKPINILINRNKQQRKTRV